MQDTAQVALTANVQDLRTEAIADIHHCGRQEVGLLEECEFGEDAIKKAYQDAMEEEDLPSYVREMLSDQESIIIDAHDEIKELRDSVQ